MGTLGFILLVLAIAAILAVLGWLGYRFFQFKSTPEAVWRDHFLNFAGVFEEKLRALRKEIDEAKNRRSVEVEKERVRALNRYLASISLDALQDYPGIGPATVDSLRQAGMTTVQTIPAKLQVIPGIGPRKEQVVKEAVRQVLNDAQSRFDAGGCREAQDWSERVRLIDRALTQQLADAAQSSRHCEHALEHLRPVMAIARKVTFIGYMRKRSIAELTADLLNTQVEKFVPPLPSVAVQSPFPAVVPAPAAFPGTREKAAAIPTAVPVIIHPQPIQVSVPANDLFRSALETGAQSTAPQAAEHPRLGHLRAVANFGLTVARADGRIANSEREVMREYLQQTFGHETELAPWINPLMDAAERKPPSLEQCLADMQGHFDGKERQGLYRLACDIVEAAGKRTAKKKACLERIAEAWGMTATPAAIAATPVATTANHERMHRDECLAALEISSTATINADLIRRQYRLLSEKIDPNRLESHGSDFVQLAVEKRARIEKAAQALLEELGETFGEEKKPEEPKDLRHNPDLDAVFGM